MISQRAKAIGVFASARWTCVLAASAALLLSGCSGGLPSLPSFSSSDETKTTTAKPAEEIYNRADNLLSRGKYKGAAKAFEDVDREHPYSPYARRALALAAFAYYKDEDYPEAIKAGRRYTTLHSGTKDAALAHHVIAMSYFDQISDPKRDQSKTKQALNELNILVRRYPDSTYAKQARNRIRIARDVLAASEMQVGRYYMRDGNHLAAINRFRTVVTKYQTTAHVEEALARLTESYMALGIRNEAQTAAAVLGHNFPQSRWYKDSYALLKSDGLAPREDQGSWISRSWKSTVKTIQGV
ncbi:MAG: outer membrane protein assembly factor BamD, partial [Hyphomicrobiaceae bacterium]